MLNGMKKFWRDIMTEDNTGTTYCPVRILSFGLVNTHIGATIAQVAMHGTFDPVGFGTGSAALLAAIGAGIGIKSKMGADAP